MAIPANATTKRPAVTGPHRVYLPRVHKTSVYWALWSAERGQWTLPYGGFANSPQPSFESMERMGHLKWSEPGVMLHWVESPDDLGSDAHLARALNSGA